MAPAASLMPVEEALARILASLPAPKEPENLVLSECYGRILASDIGARRTQPPADLSAMDGYAVRAADCAAAPVTLTLVGEAAAGGSFDRHIQPGEAVRIFTGAPVPQGADAIVIQEDTERDGAHVRILEPAQAGRHIRRAGVDFRTGDIGLRAGRRLEAPDIALAAAMNWGRLPVHKQPVIAFFSTGDELIPPGTNPGPNQIVSSNNAGLDALIRQAGGIPLDLGIAPDDAKEIRSTARRARSADMLVTIGGASVGDHDLVQSSLAKDGLDIAFWRIAMRPGKPLMFGHYGSVPMLGLPGNPVSALVCALLFLVPAIAHLQGGKSTLPTQRVPLANALPANDRRQDYIRARWAPLDDGTWAAEPFPAQDSSLLSVLAQAGGLIVRAPHAPAAAQGSMVPMLVLRPPEPPPSR